MPANRRNGSVPWKIWIPPNLALQIERLYFNPITGKPDYGSRSHLVTALLEQFVREAHKHEANTIRKLVNDLVERGKNLEDKER